MTLSLASRHVKVFLRSPLLISYLQKGTSARFHINKRYPKIMTRDYIIRLMINTPNIQQGIQLKQMALLDSLSKIYNSYVSNLINS